MHTNILLCYTVTTVYILCTNYYVSLVHINIDVQVKNSNIVIFILYKRPYLHTIKNLIQTNQIYLQRAYYLTTCQY